MIRRLVRFVDERTGGAPLLQKALRYVFPDHWSFLLGEIALYAFVVLIATGVYLTLFFEPSLAETVYRGDYAPLHGLRMSEAYRSTVDISLNVKAGLLIRQTHHWAADVFVVAIVLHVLRVVLTGAFRKPRELVYYVGLLMLMLALLEGFLGYSLVDDLLSGMGLAIAYSVVMSVPFIGANVALALWGAPFPGVHDFESRMYIAHVFVLPGLIGLLLVTHLLLIMSRHHTQFAGPRRSEGTVVGLRAFPAYAPRTIALALTVAGVLFLLGGLVQINPIWEWGPYSIPQGTNGAQPDWYLGWLIGGLRLMPGFDVVIGNYTLIPNPFWGGVLVPLLVFGALFAWPSLERRLTGDRAFHNLLDRPRDRPWRTAVAAAFFTWVAVLFVAGSSDRVFVYLGIPYTSQIWFWRGAVFVLPALVLVLTRRLCLELQEAERVQRVREAAERGVA
jgi:ubiquinol-cytochrome c reductase cytochrome b subunit